MKHELKQDIQKVIYSPRHIAGMVKKVGAEISRDYAGKCPLLVVVLKGSVVFAADLMRSLTIDCEVDFMIVSSYVGTQSVGQIQVVQDLRADIAGREVIIVEDIIDSGVTLFSLKKLLEERGPSSVKICTLLDKPSGRKADIKADYAGGKVGDEFIVGYGLDYNEKYRNLPFVGVLKESVYSHK
ncbi:MAG: hypoxanthine phosphoribosyltransferase [Clostridia bacterium]|nr:hypoxanthine phosphoribosyltransferase [Clostridia bacterium]